MSRPPSPSTIPMINDFCLFFGFLKLLESFRLLIDFNDQGKDENIRVIESGHFGGWDGNAICITKSRNFVKNYVGVNS